MFLNDFFNSLCKIEFECFTEQFEQTLETYNMAKTWSLLT